MAHHNNLSRTAELCASKHKENPVSYKKIFSGISVELKNMENSGAVAAYIPKLREVDPNKFGAHLLTIDNQHFCFGDSNEKFSIQSIAKVLSLAMAFELEEDKLWKRVGVEPSGISFNSLLQLETGNGIPRNPLVNAGALVISDILVGRLKDPKRELLDFIRKASGNAEITYSPAIAESEKLTGFKNAALINLMKSYGNIKTILIRFWIFTSIYARLK
jgi:glutaminase